MKIKVCGMKYPENISDLSTSDIDMIGMIFYPLSSRYVANKPKEELDVLKQLIADLKIKTVGVFVDESIENVLQISKEYKLDIVQLHGNESADYCREIEQHIPIIKVFSISCESDIVDTKLYEGLCSYFLFDTKTLQHGGSGVKFDWNILSEYKGNTPFILSGGISPNDADLIKSIKHPLFIGIDINSRFEIEAGLKDIDLLNQFIKELKS